MPRARGHAPVTAALPRHAPQVVVADLSATTARRVTDELRRRILAGDFASGQRLKIDDLAARLGVSHMPVREALRALEAEGVLDVLPHRGAIVRGVDRTFIENFYDIRAALEDMLAARCAARIEPRSLARLKEAAADFEAAAGGDAAEMVASNRRFHDVINAVAANPEALRMLSHGRVLADALRLRYGYGGGRVDTIVAEHRALVDAIERRDASQAGQIARRHCIAARDDLLTAC